MHFQDYYAAAIRQGWFDPGFYFDLLQSRGISVHDSSLSLFEHYATAGWRRGLAPSARFSVRGYLSQYSDVREQQVDPLYHFLVRGHREQRKAPALFEQSDAVQFAGLIECRSPGEDEAQLALAQANGITAFCIHHDASRGASPGRDIAASMDTETSFCLFLDHGGGGEGALEAHYRLAHDMLDILSDPRHLRVCGKPLLIVRSPESLADAPLTFGLWREVARRAGLGGLFVAGLPLSAGARETLGLDGLIDAHKRSRLEPPAAALPVFPGFMPDRDPSQWPGNGAHAADLFTTWAASAAARTKALSQRNLPRLAFVDARTGRAGWQEFLKGAAVAPEPARSAVVKLRQFAAAITASSRLPVLFLCDGAAGSQMRLIASLQTGLEPFRLSLSELDGTGWSRGQTATYLAGLLRRRGDLVVVSPQSATADLLGPFAAHGHGTVSLLDDAGEPATVAGLARCARRILVGSETLREQISTADGIPAADMQVVQPPGEPAIGDTLSRLGNDGRRIRASGITLGRQAIAEDLCVVIPSYNHRPYITAALDSVLAQSLRPKEIRIIDDGSNDGSAELVRSLASEELGIIVEARENRGAQATMNQGVAETECPIVAILNSDDSWHPLRVEELIGGLRRPGGDDVVFSRLRFMGSQALGEQKRRWSEDGVADYRSGTPLWLALMFCNFFFTTSNLIARREKFLEVGGFGALRYCHDLDYMLKAISAGQKVKFVEQTLCDYRVHARNTIDEDVDKVLFEEAWIILESLQRSAGRISEAELSRVAQRACDKGLATRILAIMRSMARNGGAFDDKLVHGLEPDDEAGAPEPAELARKMARLVSVQHVEAMPAMRG